MNNQITVDQLCIGDFILWYEGGFSPASTVVQVVARRRGVHSTYAVAMLDDQVISTNIFPSSMPVTRVMNLPAHFADTKFRELGRAECEWVLDDRRRMEQEMFDADEADDLSDAEAAEDLDVLLRRTK